MTSPPLVEWTNTTTAGSLSSVIVTTAHTLYTFATQHRLFESPRFLQPLFSWPYMSSR